MKHVNRNFAFLVLATISLFSCQDDDSKPDNKFTLGGNTFNVSTGVFLKDVIPGTNDDGDKYYRNALVFFSDEVNVTVDGGELITTGQGDFIEFLINNEDRELKAGTYTWQAEENEQPFDLWAGKISINWNKESEIDYELGSGTLTMTKSGKSYKGSFEGVAYLTDEDGERIIDSNLDVAFQFKGSLLQADNEF